MPTLAKYGCSVLRRGSISKKRFSYLGIMYDNIKAGYIFSTFSNIGSSLIGLIKNVKL